MRGSVHLVLALAWGLSGAQAGTFRVATYNLESYLDSPTTTRAAKSPESKAQVRASILAARPDLLALQEMGSLQALLELRDSLKRDGLDFPFWEHLTAADTNIHLAILSKFPIAARRPHTNENFLLGGRRHQVSRGFAEIDLQVGPDYSLTLITAHLKSKRPVPTADESELRHEEAKLLRRLIDARLQANPACNLVVLGDLNDGPDAPSTRTVIGGGRAKLVDARPAERHAGPIPSANDARAVTWTHFYPAQDAYNRIDYILLSPGLAREWIPAESFVLAVPGWGIASDHRPLVAVFEDVDR